jgi:hypothetical protein
MRRLGLNRLRKHDPKPPVQRQLARLERIGHRITGDPRKSSSPGARYERVHMAVDDDTRLS